MSSCICSIEWLTDMPWWIDTIVGLFITIFGLYAAMWLQQYSEDKKELKNAIFCIESIIKELDIISVALKESNIDAHEPNKNRIETPIWDGILRAGLGQALAKLDKYLQVKKKLKGQNAVANWYNKLFDFYNDVNDFNKWGEMYTNMYLSQLVVKQENPSHISKVDIDIKNQLFSIIQYCEVLLDNVITDKDKLKTLLNEVLKIWNQNKREKTNKEGM